jgi:UDP-N-acetylglucosamine 2-epimerase (non-hydrolysing)
MIKVLSVFGTRPEAIKMAPVVKALEQRSAQIVSRVCVTAQHREMLDQILTLFDIQHDYDLNLMQPNQTLEQLTTVILNGLTPIIKKEHPDWLLVEGDTTSVMAASLAAFYHNVNVGHVEAGLRTRDKRQPFPEEINRRIAGVIADWHFAPTLWARENLLQEGVTPAQVLVTGNSVIDALLSVANKPYEPLNGPLATIPWDKRLILVTAHRRESFGQPLENICLALQELATRYRNELHIVYPVHLNPNVQQPVYRLLAELPNVTLLSPLDYQPLVYLMKQCTLILTDSGGIQEEAPGLDKPVLVLRAKTERPEGVEAGVVRLVGTNQVKIVNEVSRLLDNASEYQRMVQNVNPYGDGRAAERMVKSLLGETVQPFQAEIAPLG